MDSWSSWKTEASALLFLARVRPSGESPTTRWTYFCTAVESTFGLRVSSTVRRNMVRFAVLFELFEIIQSGLKPG